MNSWAEATAERLGIETTVSAADWLPWLESIAARHDRDQVADAAAIVLRVAYTPEALDRCLTTMRTLADVLDGLTAEDIIDYASTPREAR